MRQLLSLPLLWLQNYASSSSLGLLGPGTVALLAPGAAIGYLAHLALDASTKSGIWLLLPKDKRIGLPRKYAVRTGSPTEMVISGGMALVTLVLAIAVFALALGGVDFLYG